MNPKVWVAIMVFGGLFSIFCSIMNFNWFIENPKASLFLKLFGRTGARIFYIVLGIFITVGAVMAYVSGQLGK